MKKYCVYILLIATVVISSCGASRKASRHTVSKKTTSTNGYRDLSQPLDIDRGDLIRYAKKFLGTPYKYGSTNPKNGFDCSGFVYYVLQHFGVKPPRVSYEYGNVGETIKAKHAKPGDIILFTGSGGGKKIGHMGFVTDNDDDEIQFIHASSPRSGGVIISKLSGYYEKHFVKVIRILK